MTSISELERSVWKLINIIKDLKSYWSLYWMERLFCRRFDPQSYHTPQVGLHKGFQLRKFNRP